MKFHPLPLAAVIIAAFTGCSAPQAIENDGLSIVTTTTQVTEFTSEIIGDEGEVTGLIQPNQSAHSFDPSARQQLALTEADALVISGAGLEPWIENLIVSAGYTGPIIDASTGIELLVSGESEEDHAEHEEEHDHGEGDPHIWTSPENAMVMVANISQGLQEISGLSSDQKEAMSANAQAYEQKLMLLDEWVQANMDTVPDTERLLVTNHDAFTYFVNQYGITFVGSIIPSFDDNAGLDPQDIDALKEKIVASGATAIFSENSISPKDAEAIALDTGVKVFSGEDALYSDSLGVSGSAGATYISATIHNVQMLMESWGYPSLPVPTELQT